MFYISKLNKKSDHPDTKKAVLPFNLYIYHINTKSNMH